MLACHAYGSQNANGESLITDKEAAMTLTTLLVILLVLVLIGALPVYPYSREWGYYPSGTLAVVVAVVAVMLLI